MTENAFGPVSRRQFGKTALGALAGVAALGAPDRTEAGPVAGMMDSFGPAYIDLRRYDGPDEIDCDLCIAGAGAAGITLARLLAKRGRRVVLLESGGFTFDGETQGLYAGTQTGQPYYSLTSSRLRYFGGTTNHWGGFCNIPRELDMQARPAMGIPAWSMRYEEMMAYIERAAVQLGFDPKKLDPYRNPEAAGVDPADLIEREGGILRTQTNMMSARENRLFNPRFRAEIGALPEAQVFLYANLTHIQMMDNGATVKHLAVKSLTGKTLTIRPKVTVLACHAIENARLLLASNDVVKPGLGNGSDHVGRHFMDHIHITTGTIRPTSDDALDHYYTDPIVPLRGRAIWSLLSLMGPVLEENGMLPYCSSLEPVFTPAHIATGDAVGRLVKAFFKPYDAQIGADLGTVLARPASGAGSLLARLGLAERRPLHFELSHHLAQVPSDGSRVTLKPERDRLGVPTVTLNWSISDHEIHTFQRAAEIVGPAIEKLGLGRFTPGPAVTPDFVRQTVLGHWHHMGTTRMAPAASEGVVDPNCRVHGTDNLYVAGSGVFPSTTISGPTMMLIALAIRLADHLNSTVLA